MRSLQSVALVQVDGGQRRGSSDPDEQTVGEGEPDYTNGHENHGRGISRHGFCHLGTWQISSGISFED